MPSPWEILGLDEPTDNLKHIKKAYARKLKLTRPDDDPEGFMALREALNMAQGHALYLQHTHDDEVFDEIQNEPQACEPLEVPDSNPDRTDEYEHTEDAVPNLTDLNSIDVVLPSPVEPPDTQSPTHVEEVMEDVHSLMRDPFGRADKTRWTALFDDPRLEAIDDANDFEDAFLYYLLDNFGYLDGDSTKHNSNRKPKPIASQIATHIFNEMGWRDTLARPLYIQDQLEWLRRDLDVINRPRDPMVYMQSSPTQIEQSDNHSKWIPIIIFCFYMAYLLYNALT